jgi:hypothetical protein
MEGWLMPETLTAIVAAIGTTAGGSLGAFLIMNAGAVATGVLAVGGLALSGWQAKRAKSKARDAYNAAQVDRFANVVTTIAQRELVLGRVRKGGAVYFRGSAGQYKTRFVAHLALAAHEIDAVEQVYLNDQPVTLDEYGNVLTAPYYRVTNETAVQSVQTGTASFDLSTDPVPDSVSLSTIANGIDAPASPVAFTISGRTVTLTDGPAGEPLVCMFQYAVPNSLARIRWDLGAGTAVADERTRELFPDLWTADHRGQGVAKLIAEFTYDETAFPSGIPAVTATIRGAKVYDPRSGLTAWSSNPALLARHVYQHPHFGKATISTAEDARFITAANACDTAQTWNLDDGSSATYALFSASLVAPFGAAARDVLDDLTQAMGGVWAFAGGELFIRAGVYTAPVLSLTDADLAVIQRQGESQDQEAVAIAVHRERAQKFNTVNVRIWDSAQGYKQVALTPVKGTALITRDGEELAQEVTLAAVPHAPQAQHIAGIMMRDARDPLVFEATFKLRAWPLEIFDTVNLTLARYGWSSKTFMVLQRVWDRSKGTVRLTLKETAAAIYTPDATFLAQGYADNTSNPNPWNIQPPALSAARVYSGTDELVQLGDGTILTRVRVAWPALADLSLTNGGSIEVEWSRADALAWQRVQVAGDATEAVLIGPADGNQIVVRARSRNAVAVSNWSLQVAHTVVGKTEPPADVESFAIDGEALRWTAVDGPDVAGYRIRLNYGSNTFWGSGAPLHEGLITSSPYTLAARPSGRVTLLIKAVDTSGNESANAAAVLVDLGDPSIDNILVSYPEAPDFDGTITNGAVSGGALQASNTDLFYGDDGQPFYGADTDDFYAAGTYAQMVYEFSATPAAEGVVVLQHTIAASDYTIEFKRDNQGAFYGLDADLFYGSDDEAFYGTPGEYQTWPGSITLDAPEGLTFRITTAGGPTQGVISQATVVLDVPDVVEEFNDLAISPGGTRLTLTEDYRAIRNLTITVQTDGNGGTSARYEDKDNLTDGPLVIVTDSTGSSVSGLVDVQVRGY